MELIELGEIIASRKLSVSRSNEASIEVLIGRPLPFPDSGDYYAPYQIIGIGDEKVRYAGGIDSVQCLQLVLDMIGYDLDAINDTVGHTLSWVGNEDGDLGFGSRL